MTPPRRRLSISSLSSVAFGCVKLGVGVTVAAGAVAYAAVQVYRGPLGRGEEDSTDDIDANCTKAETNGVHCAEETTDAHAMKAANNETTNDPNEHSHHTSEHSASTPEPEPTPPDSPLPETPIDMVHRDDKADQNQKSPSPPLPRHRRKVSFAPIPETEEATFTPEPVVQVDPIVTVQPPSNDATETASAASKTGKKNKRKSQKKKKTPAGSATHAQTVSS